MEPIVPRDVIREQARAAADKQFPKDEANPYPDGTAAHARFELDYLRREREISEEIEV